MKLLNTETADEPSSVSNLVPHRMRSRSARRRRPRTAVHAGPLLLRLPGGERALRRFLRIPRAREVFLVHHGHEALRRVARQSGVSDITVDSSEQQQSFAATEMAVTLGARHLDFTIDEAGVSRFQGEFLDRIDIREAELLARDPNVRPRVRAKLAAGCAALREGVARVRIGNPISLASNRATILTPDASEPEMGRVRFPSPDAQPLGPHDFEAPYGDGLPTPAPAPRIPRRRRQAAIATSAVGRGLTGRPLESEPARAERTVAA